MTGKPHQFRNLEITVKRTVLLLFVLSFVPASLVSEDSLGQLTDNRILTSEVLGYDLQYRVWAPSVVEEGAELPVIYLTDGQWYLEPGGFAKVLNELLGKGKIDPVIAVFVDNRDPHDLENNRRNSQFFCNARYIEFFEKELVPTIDRDWPASPRREDRAILGLSFGGLNSACFGLHAHETFGGIAMQSPALHPVPSIHEAWSSSDRLPVRVFLSSGTKGDNEASTRRLQNILKRKGYDMLYLEVPFGHDWKNWRPLLDDVLLFFFAAP